MGRREKRSGSDRRQRDDLQLLLEKAIKKLSGNPDLLELAQPHLREIIDKRQNIRRKAPSR